MTPKRRSRKHRLLEIKRKKKKRFKLVSILSSNRKCFMVFKKHNVHRQQPEKSEIFIFSGLSLSRLVDTKLTSIGPLQDPVTWFVINYTGTPMTQWDFQNKGILTSPAQHSFVLKVPQRHLRPTVIYFVPCDRILQGAYLNNIIATLCLLFLR